MDSATPDGRTAPVDAPGVQWRRALTWEPHRQGWRIAALFMAGSFLFALGSFPAYAQLVDPGTVGITFVIGSILFTAAGYSAFVEEINRPDAGADAPPRTRYWAWMPHRVLWWAAIVQLVGTVLFNFNTIDAMIESLDIEETNRLVWAPDVIGSTAFLVASHLAWLTVCRRLWCVRRDDVDWWIAALNYVGSIFFMASALASFTLETTGEAVNTTIVNSGTFLGALCFLFGAYLLLPARSEPAPPAAATP